MGLILLGPKKSEEPYSAGDKKLIGAIADQAAVVCENRWLSDRVDREARVRREVLAHLDDERINLVKQCPSCGLCFDHAASHCPTDGTELELTLPVERILDDRYRLDRSIGRGGMGAVFEATDLRLSRTVALKIMMGHLFGDRTAQLRFEREARASANLRHPNIVQIHDYGRIGADGAYLVMELIEGSTLREELRKHGPIGPAALAEILDGLLDGLAAAHAAGVIHRDLKPENVMLVRSPSRDSSSPGKLSAKILDFGLAKVATEALRGSGSLTATGAVLGTWAYMSPEQIAGGEIDERSDLYTVGAMTVEALTGRRPFERATPAQLQLAMNRGRVSFGPGGSHVRLLERLVNTAIATDPMHRFQSADAMRDALVPVLRSCRDLDPTAIHTD